VRAGDRVSLRVDHAGRVATIWLDRPDKRNAITVGMWEALARACASLAADASVRVLVLRGAGEHFSAGADIAELGQADPVAHRAANQAAEDSLASFPKPTLAVLRGSCVGGGAGLAVACDLRLADDTVRVGITPARLGIVYPPFALERVVRLIGPSAAKHLLFTAELIDASRALRIGLVDEVHPPGGLDARVDALTDLLAERRSLLTQAAAKEMIDAVGATGRIDTELGERWAAAAARAPDAAEGIAAFLERREPRFTWMPRAET
jgi:enoyl-CoA hydratase/carnithine racemase